ncbi:DoxX family [Acididesulfobacillus acetoxydans]|uniref:DoxX family n=1 Tax=Acididesulfobacillus acetoxydans TaxID=1561005 RepID=A0A8S0WML4_9FIRM|nr:DoxX family protein [Acididesulfobacillus acetoxydans]CAA7600644.1 DoxX family [Acididesulfobacillus acetoxydans]CEJ09425.1 DoxX protein [Acididesulfobacillus acetoxydans]
MAWRESRWLQVVWTILRVYLGWEWLSSGLSKVFGPGSAAWVGPQAGSAVSKFLKAALVKSTGAHPDVQRWYASFINGVALPNATAFSYLVAWGELLIGIALIIGFLTTIALLLAVFLNLNYLLAGTVSTNPMDLLWAALLLWAGSAAYYWGVDRIFIPRWKKFRLNKA